MNEFIVWDKRSKCFILNDEGFDRFEMYMDGTLHYYQNCHDGEGFGSEDYESFNYIGLKDINNNKIYADSSIVEFEHRMHGKCRGVFSYSNTELAYLIKLISVNDFTFTDKTRINYNVIDISDVNLLDTIQENKLGLIK